MDFLRLHLPGLHQALRGALDSLSSFVSYLTGAEVPTAERKEARAAEELGEVAAGRPGKPEEKKAQEALEGLGGSQNQEAGGLRGPGEAGRRQEGSSATEQTWGWEEGSSHGSQADRQDTGVWEAAEAARCQEPRAHLEARKESKAGSEAGRDNSSQARESQGPNEQEVNREETPRTWEQEEEAEEVRERKPEVARKAESEWTWHREPEGEVGADGQKVAGDSRGSLEQTVKEAVAEEIQGSGAKEAGKEEEVMGVLRDSQSTRAQEAWESGTESEDGTTSGREEDGTASGREEDGTASGREEDGTTSGREEDGTASGREEDGTASGREEDSKTSDREEDSKASDREEARTVSGKEEAGTSSGREEDGTTSSRVEDGTASESGEDGTASGREEDGTTSGRVEDCTASDSGEDGTVSDREEARTVSGKEEAKTATGREEDGTTSGKEEDSTASEREEDSIAPVREEEEEDRTASGREEAGITLVSVEGRTTSVGKEGDLSGARKREYGEVSGERISEGTGRAWAFEGASRGDQEEEMDENREAEMSCSPKETQALGTKGTEEATKDQTAAGEAAEGHGSEGEVGEGFEIQADQEGKEAEGRQASAIRTVPASPEEVVEAEKTKEEEEGCWASEAELPKDDVANEAEGDADLEATLETSSPEKEFGGERSEGEAQTGGEAQGVEWGGLEHEITEGQEPELMAGPQTLTEQPEVGQGGEEELWGVSALSKEEMEGSLEEYPRKVGDVKPDAPGAEVWENQRRDVEGGDTQEEKADTEEGEEEAAGGQAPKEAQGGRESALPDVPEAGGEWKKAQDAGYGAEEGDTPGAESQELGGRHGADAGTGQSLGESDARETEDVEVEATVPWGADTTSSGDWRLEEAARSLQDSEDPGVSSLAAEIVRDKVALVGRAAGAGGGLEREAGEAEDSKGKQEAGGGVELVEATWGENRSGPEFGLAGSADEEVAGRGGQAEALEAREGEPGGEWVEVREPAAAEGSCGMGGFISGSQVAKAEGTVATVEAEGLPGGQTLLEEEAVGWQMKEQGRGREGQCGDHHPEGEARRPLDVEDAAVTEDQRAQAEEIVPEGPEDVQGPEDQSTHREPAEAERGPHGETAASAGQGAGTSWSEALLPGSLLDVSVPRSRVLLSRNSSLRRSRPSSRRPGAPEQQEEPPRPPPEEEMSACEQRLLQPEEPPEPSPPEPEGTPLPARRRPLGRGFGLAHIGMMQELQARLGQPKPQGGP
ncbi:apolipoprotein B receptor [Phoca vitulina]|uniref:apolipoprotein B receptor n=1 Tax=Phoca vitulina TaxID=9720 RepID=UPI001396623E|nr:apolipoprotein B receptor [Phoca vitulina]